MNIRREEEGFMPHTTVTALKVKYQRTPAYSWWVLVVSMLCFMCFFVAMNATAVFGTLIQEDFGINATLLSFLSTATMIAFCVFPTFTGTLFEKYGITTMVPIALCMNILSGLLLFIPFFSDTYIGYIITRFICGLTGCLNGPIAAHLCLWFPKNRAGFASGILMGFLGVGFSVTAAIGPILLNMGLTWQMATAAMTIVPSAVMALVFRLTVKDFKKVYPEAETMGDLMPPVDEKIRSTRYANEPKATNIKEMWRSKRCWCAALMALFFTLPIYGLNYTLPLYFQNDMGLTLGVASSIVAATFIWKLLASPAGGAISDIVFKGERNQINMISALLCSVFLFVLLAAASTGNITLITALAILAFFSASLYGGTLWTMPNDLGDKKTSFAISGFIVGISNIGAVLVQPICGMLIDATGTGTSALLFIAIGILIAIPFARGARL